MPTELCEVKVWGDYACFTRPEMKVERVSYPVMTPSAARGVLEAILWKPEMRWRVWEIWVLNPVRHASLMRNEVNDRASPKAATSWMNIGGGYLADDDRAQRHTLALRNVSYLIRAEIQLTGKGTDPITKYREIFLRRVHKGQCFHRPYLGCREFAASFGPAEGNEQPIDLEDDLGLVLLDLDYANDRTGRGTPRFFRAGLRHGILRVPPNPEGKEMSRAPQSLA
jgi:CRISPR-associated protein Cas5d